MSEDVDNTDENIDGICEDAGAETRTAAEECICAALAEACYVCGGTPDDLRELIEKSSEVKELYCKQPYFFKGVRVNGEDSFFYESTDVCF